MSVMRCHLCATVGARCPYHSGEQPCGLPLRIAIAASGDRWVERCVLPKGHEGEHASEVENG